MSTCRRVIPYVQTEMNCYWSTKIGILKVSVIVFLAVAIGTFDIEVTVVHVQLVRLTVKIYGR